MSSQVEVSKTGMGSSAALTTSLVGALLHGLGIIAIDSTGLDRQNVCTVVHNLSQLAHCIAQGKIGSGFDVSAAVYGSQIYQRFDPKQFDLDREASSGEKLYSAVMDRGRWTQSVRKFSLPRGMGLVMADVCGGSSSSSMARGVLAWRAKNPDVAGRIWENLIRSNIDIQDCVINLKELSDKYIDVYDVVIAYACHCNFGSRDIDDTELHVSKIVKSGALNKSTSGDYETIWTALLKLKRAFGQSRRLLREMGHLSGQDIEPEQQQVCMILEFLYHCL